MVYGWTSSSYRGVQFVPPFKTQARHRRLGIQSCKSAQHDLWHGFCPQQRKKLFHFQGARGACYLGQQLIVRGSKHASLSVAQAAFGPAWHAVVDSGVMTAVTAAFVKLLMLSCFVGWLLRSGKLYDETAPILSQVMYQALLPAAFMVRLASALAQSLDSALLVIPLVATFQVGLGAVLGRVAGHVVEGAPLRSLLGWHPRTPAGSAQAIALAAAAATGVPSAADALMSPPASATPRGTKEVVMLACAFGSCWAMPLGVLGLLVGAPGLERATHYCACFTAAWAALLWTWGYRNLIHAGGIAEAGPDLLRQQNASMGWAPAQQTLKSTSAMLSQGWGASKRSNATALAQSAWAYFTNIACHLKQAFNPPLVGVACGVLIGLTPLHTLLFGPDAAAAAGFASRLPFELWFTLGIAKAAVEVAAVAAGACLAMQAVIVGVSAFDRGLTPTPPWLERLRAQSSSPSGGSSGGARPQLVLRGSGVREAGAGNAMPARRDALSNRTLAGDDRPPVEVAGSVGRPPLVAWPGARWLALLLPQDEVASRALAAVLLVRGLLLPIANLGLLAALHSVGRLPADPLCLRILLLQGSMPPAHSLVTLLQLKKPNRTLASGLAGLILRAHLLFILPTGLWCGLLWNM